MISTKFNSLHRRVALSPFRIVVTAVALAAAVMAIYPLAKVFSSFFFPGGSPNFGALGEIREVDDLQRLLWNTFSIVIVSGILALTTGAVLAWLNERTDARLGVIGRAMPILPFLIPPVASGIGWLLLFHPTVGIGNTYIRSALGAVGITMESGPLNIASWWGLTIVMSIVHIPYSYMIIAAALRNLDGALEEQSRVCGAGAVTTLWRVTLPGIRNSIGAAVLLLVFFGLADYSIPVIIGNAAKIDVMAVRIVALMTHQYPPQVGPAVALSLVGVAMVGTLWYLQRRLLGSRNYFTLGGKGQSPTVTRLGKWRRPAQIFSVGFILTSSILPLISLVVVALTGYWTAQPKPGSFSLNAFKRVLIDDPASVLSLRNSLFLGVVGATLGVVIASLTIEFVNSGKPSRFKTVVDGLVKAPATFSIIIVTIGIILAFSGAPFYLGATLTILLIGYVVVYMPQASVTIESSATQVGTELREASALAGSAPFGTYRRVVLPLMIPGLVAGWALLFVRMLGDLTISVMLAGPSTSVVGFRILNTYSNGSFGDLAALTLVVTVITTTVVFVLFGVSERLSRLSRSDGKSD